MRIDKIVLEKSASALMIATLQQQNADKQQVISTQQHRDADQLEGKADKLDALGDSLIANAVEIKGDTIVVQRGQDECPERPVTQGRPSWRPGPLGYCLPALD